MKKSLKYSLLCLVAIIVFAITGPLRVLAQSCPVPRQFTEETQRDPWVSMCVNATSADLAIQQIAGLPRIPGQFNFDARVYSYHLSSGPAALEFAWHNSCPRERCLGFNIITNEAYFETLAMRRGRIITGEFNRIRDWIIDGVESRFIKNC